MGRRWNRLSSAPDSRPAPPAALTDWNPMNPTVDNLSDLEQRVEGLIQQLETARRNNQELRQENQRLQRELEGLSGAQGEKEALQGEVDRLKQELDSMSGREGVIRDRLQGMLEKIDAIEKEIQTSSTPD